MLICSEFSSSRNPRMKPGMISTITNRQSPTDQRIKDQRSQCTNALFASQRDRRIHLRGPSRRQIAGEHRRHRQQEDSHAERERIASSHAEQEIRHQLRREPRGNEARSRDRQSQSSRPAARRLRAPRPVSRRAPAGFRCPVCRRVTSYEITPYRPTQASSSASAPNAADSVASSRSVTSDASICSRIVRTHGTATSRLRARTSPRTMPARAAGSSAVRTAAVRSSGGSRICSSGW